MEITSKFLSPLSSLLNGQKNNLFDPFPPQIPSKLIMDLEPSREREVKEDGPRKNRVLRGLKTKNLPHTVIGTNTLMLPKRESSFFPSPIPSRA